MRVVIVFPPGGATDSVGRLVFQRMGEQLNQQFVIDNQAGASGTIGAALVSKSAPAGTPKPIIDMLNAELKKAVADPDVAAKLSAQTLDPMYMTTEDFAKHLKAEYDKYGRVVKLAGARID